jgi:hypothetical protein
MALLKVRERRRQFGGLAAVDVVTFGRSIARPETGRMAADAHENAQIGKAYRGG